MRLFVFEQQMHSRYAIALFFLFVSALLFLCLPSVANASDYRRPEVNVFEMQNGGTKDKKQKTFLAAHSASENGAQIAVANTNGTGGDEIIVGAGPGEEPYVRIYTGGGVLVKEFLAYDRGMKSGVNVAAGDLNRDGKAEIVTAPGAGAKVHVRVFAPSGKPTINKGFFPFSSGFRGGAQVAIGNVRGDNRNEIIVSTGPGTKPRVKIYYAKSTKPVMTIAPFGDGDKGGVSIATANVEGEEHDEIITAIHSFGEPRVKIYDASDAKPYSRKEFLAYSKKFRGGVNVASADLNNDGKDEIITATRENGGPHVRTFNASGKVVDTGFFAYEKDFRGGVQVAAGNIDDDSKKEIVTAPQKKRIQGRDDLIQYIDVDLSEQKLRAYRNGILEREFLVSTGIDRYATPKGNFKVLQKIANKDYRWEYGPEHPDNYDIKNVPWNLRFNGPFYLHNAYWHNNFGHQMSHGCININLENSKWIYDWAPVGTPVIVHD